MESKQRPRSLTESVRVFFDGIRTLKDLTGDEKYRLYGIAGIIFVLQAFEIGESVILKYLVDAMPQAMQKGWFTYDVVFWLSAMCVLMISSIISSHFFKEYLFLKSAIKLENLWPTKALKKLVALPFAYHEENNTGKIISKINKGNSRSLDILLALFWEFIPHVFFVLANAIFLFIIDWRLATMFCSAVVPMALLNMKSYIAFVEKWDRWEQLKENADTVFCEAIINFAAVKSYVMDESILSEHQQKRQQMADLDLDFSFTIQKYFASIRLLLKFTWLGTIGFALYLLFVDSEFNSVGTIVYIMTSGNAVNISLWKIIHVYSRIMRHLVSVHRLKKLLDEPVSVQSNDDAIVPATCEGRIEYHEVGFSYNGPDTQLFSGFSAQFEPGTTTAIVGPSGSGKTTLVKLLPRFYDVTSGVITLDGVDIRLLDLSFLRDQIATVTQLTGTGIFDDTIAGNIRVGDPAATDAEVWEALTAANLGEDVKQFSGQLHQVVGEMGVTLSGGQCQRLLIARAYLKLKRGANIIVFDEATSNLDSVSEKAIHEMIVNLRKATGRKITVIIIAHRFATIESADYIYVVDNGKVVEEGDHARLEQHNGLFMKLKRMQQLGELS